MKALRYFFSWLLCTAFSTGIIWAFGGDVFQRGFAMGCAVVMAIVWWRILEGIAKGEKK